MKSFFAFLICLFSVSAFGANPTFQAFKGTNGTTIRTNVNGNLVSMDSSPGVIIASNSLVSQIASGQVWTNDGGFIGPTFTPYHTSAEPAGTPAVAWRVFQTNDSDATLGMAVGIHSDGSVSNQNSYSIVGQNSSGRSGSSNSLYNVNGAIGVVGETLGGSVDGTGQGTGVLGYGLFGGNINYGVVGIAEADGGSPTNVGVAAAITQFGQNNKQVALYAEVSSDGLIDPIFTSAIILADSRESGFPLLVCRTNNGTFKVFEIDGNKTTNATSLDVKGQITAFGGLTVTTTASIKTNIANLSITSTDFTLNQYYTNSAQRAYVSAVFLCDSGISIDAGKVGLYLDQDASGGFEQTGMVVGVDLGGDGQYQLGAWLQPGARFVFTNLSSGTGSATTAAGSSQWVKQ